MNLTFKLRRCYLMVYE